MVYTKDIPSIPGHYWCRMYRMEFVTEIRIENGRAISHGLYHDGMDLTDTNGLLSGPIPAPTRPALNRPGSHTPGPWRASSSHGLCVYKDETLIADLDTSPRSGVWSGRLADARLIAAAPDLLEACGNLVDVIGDIDSGRPKRRSTWIEDDVVAARAVIAKATS